MTEINIFNSLVLIISYSFTAILITAFIVRLSNLLFGFQITQEIKKDNRAVAIFLAGLTIMLGILIGLFKL